MSMLSVQCDRLWLYAKNLRSIASDSQLVWLAADEMEEAADVIWRLRNQHFERCEELDEAREQIDHLRTLVRDMWRDIPKSESCGWDSDANCCSGSDKCQGECAYWYRMRELGIEVDG